MARCIYCGADVDGREPVPALGDDEAWDELAEAHAKDCEWIASRANRLDPVPYSPLADHWHQATLASAD